MLLDSERVEDGVSDEDGVGEAVIGGEGVAEDVGDELGLVDADTVALPVCEAVFVGVGEDVARPDRLITDVALGSRVCVESIALDETIDDGDSSADPEEHENDEGDGESRLVVETESVKERVASVEALPRGAEAVAHSENGLVAEAIDLCEALLEAVFEGDEAAVDESSGVASADCDDELDNVPTGNSDIPGEGDARFEADGCIVAAGVCDADTKSEKIAEPLSLDEATGDPLTFVDAVETSEKEG